jgi:hypothetical protein
MVTDKTRRLRMSAMFLKHRDKERTQYADESADITPEHIPGQCGEILLRKF